MSRHESFVHPDKADGGAPLSGSSQPSAQKSGHPKKKLTRKHPLPPRLTISPDMAYGEFSEPTFGTKRARRERRRAMIMFIISSIILMLLVIDVAAFLFFYRLEKHCSDMGALGSKSNQADAFPMPFYTDHFCKEYRLQLDAEEDPLNLPGEYEEVMPFKSAIPSSEFVQKTQSESTSGRYIVLRRKTRAHWLQTLLLVIHCFFLSFLYMLYLFF
ncbi:uncharacterized protein VTP21DRAFT_7569 [Calcarisporiella thermophila]|uniref:uncharacterized protein n=1 Tax=Calcarisporiella thermophila TaxID=911321 RepID=UPI0037437A52